MVYTSRLLECPRVNPYSLKEISEIALILGVILAVLAKP